ncbi:MAG: hypothetical protein PVG47_02880 [Chromatiales bacterium]|jgi:hypothetical protein
MKKTKDLKVHREKAMGRRGDLNLDGMLHIGIATVAPLSGNDRVRVPG